MAELAQVEWWSAELAQVEWWSAELADALVRGAISRSVGGTAAGVRMRDARAPGRVASEGVVATGGRRGRPVATQRMASGRVEP
jgi:hypothetical protein